MQIVTIFGLEIQKSKFEKKMLPTSAFQCICKNHLLFLALIEASILLDEGEQIQLIAGNSS
jgi:hypothetical protein